MDLRRLFSLETDQAEALESFIGARLFEAGVWSSPRTSDGITHLRVVECERHRMSVCGHIIEIDQAEHSFWLDLGWQPTARFATWALYYDVVASSPRRARNAIDVCGRADEIEWRIALSGLADLRGGALVPVQSDVR